MIRKIKMKNFVKTGKHFPWENFSYICKHKVEMKLPKRIVESLREYFTVNDLWKTLAFMMYSPVYVYEESMEPEYHTLPGKLAWLVEYQTWSREDEWPKDGPKLLFTGNGELIVKNKNPELHFCTGHATAIHEQRRTFERKYKMMNHANEIEKG